MDKAPLVSLPEKIGRLYPRSTTENESTLKHCPYSASDAMLEDTCKTGVCVTGSDTDNITVLDGIPKPPKGAEYRSDITRKVGTLATTTLNGMAPRAGLTVKKPGSLHARAVVKLKFKGSPRVVVKSGALTEKSVTSGD